MTDQNRRRPPIQREESEPTTSLDGMGALHVNGNGATHDTPTDPPRMHHFDDRNEEEMEALKEGAALTIEIVAERQRRFGLKWEERSDRVEGKVDEVIKDARLIPGIRADVKQSLALGYEAIAGIQETKAAVEAMMSSVQESLSLQRVGAANARAAQTASSQALSRSAAADHKATIARTEADRAQAVADHALREARAARDAEGRTSKSDQEALDALKNAGVELARGRAQTVVKTEAQTAALTIESQTTNVIVSRRWRVGAVALVLALGGVLVAAAKLYLASH